MTKKTRTPRKTKTEKYDHGADMTPTISDYVTNDKIEEPKKQERKPKKQEEKPKQEEPKINQENIKSNINNLLKNKNYTFSEKLRKIFYNETQVFIFLAILFILYYIITQLI